MHFSSDLHNDFEAGVTVSLFHRWRNWGWFTQGHRARRWRRLFPLPGRLKSLFSFPCPRVFSPSLPLRLHLQATVPAKLLSVYEMEFCIHSNSYFTYFVHMAFIFNCLLLKLLLVLYSLSEVIVFPRTESEGSVLNAFQFWTRNIKWMYNES